MVQAFSLSSAPALPRSARRRRADVCGLRSPRLADSSSPLHRGAFVFAVAVAVAVAFVVAVAFGAGAASTRGAGGPRAPHRRGACRAQRSGPPGPA